MKISAFFIASLVGLGAAAPFTVEKREGSLPAASGAPTPPAGADPAANPASAQAAAAATPAALAVPAGSSAAAGAPPALSDVDILQFALTLEHLEDAFYRAALANFSVEIFIAGGFSDSLYKDLQTVAKDEATHVKFLTDAITAAGGAPVAECTYNFPVMDVKTFVSLASVLEGVGTSAYLGAASSVQSPDILTVAASIMTIEARHTAFIRALLKQVPVPQPFENPLSPTSVFTLASQFIVSCPESNAPLPFTAFPPLQLGSQGAVSTGQTINILTPGFELEAAPGQIIFAVFILVTGPVAVEAVKVEGGFTAVVPPGVAGQSYVVMTGCKDKVSDAATVAGPLIVEISGTA